MANNKKRILVGIVAALAAFAVTSFIFLVGDNLGKETTPQSDETVVIKGWLDGALYFIEQHDGKWELEHEVSYDTFAELFPELHAEFEGSFPVANLFYEDTLILGDLYATYSFKLVDGKFTAKQEISHETFPTIFAKDESFWPLALDGDTLLGGDTFANETFYIFKKRNGQWELEDSVSFEDVLGAGGEFSIEYIALHGDTFVAAAENGIYIFKSNGDQWMLEQTISHETFPAVYAQAEDGYDLSPLFLWGNRLVVVKVDSVSNKVFAFKRENNKWVFEQEFSNETFPKTKPKRGYSDFFGVRLALRKDMLLVGDFDYIYVFRFEDDQWVLKQEISKENFKELKDRFATLLYLGDDILALSPSGRLEETDDDQLIYIFIKDGDNWIFKQVLDI